MPVVPVDSQVSVAPAALGGEHVPRRIGATEETFGAGGPRPNLDGLADVAAQLYQRQKRVSDSVAVMGAAAQTSALANTLSEHARSQMGTNAYHAVDDVATTWQDQTSKIEMGLANDDQKLAFRQHVASEWNSLNAVVQNHVSNQHRVVAQQAVDGYMAQQGEKALQNAPDPSPAGQLAVSEAVANTRAAIMQYGANEGQDPDYTKAHADEAVSKLHDAVVKRMMGMAQDGQQPVMAQAYYEAHKNEMFSTTSDTLNALIAKKSVEGTAQQQADSIKKQVLSLPDGILEDRGDGGTTPRRDDARRARARRGAVAPVVCR